MEHNTMIGAWLAGLRSGMSRPGLVLILWIVNLTLALPGAWILSESINDSIGPSLVHENMRDGFDMGWYGEYQASARGLESTFTPTHVGIGAFIDNLERWSNGDVFRMSRAAMAPVMMFALVWALLLGGTIERLARVGNPSDPGGFFHNGGRYFLRFLRLAVLSAPLYWLVYKLYDWIHGRLGEFTRDTTSESSVLMYTVFAVALTSFLLVVIHVSFDYAKIATVVDQRRSMLFAALRGIGFVLSHPVATLGLYFMMALISLVLLGLYSVLSPGIGQAGNLSILIAFGVSQLFLIAKMGVRVSLLAGQLALYRERG